MEARLVQTHMGRWYQKEGGKDTTPKSKTEIMLHLADYFASRSWITIDFDKDDNIIKNTNDLPSRDELNNTISTYENEKKMASGEADIQFYSSTPIS
jgi:hypothetical protein